VRKGFRAAKEKRHREGCGLKIAVQEATLEFEDRDAGFRALEVSLLDGILRGEASTGFPPRTLDSRTVPRGE